MPIPLPDAALGSVPRSRSLPRCGPGVLLLPSQKGALEALFRDVHPKQDFLPCSGRGGRGWRWSGCRNLPDLLLVSQGLPCPPTPLGRPQDACRWVSIGSCVQEGWGGGAWTQLE